jgi:hypothetical protein
MQHATAQEMSPTPKGKPVDKTQKMGWTTIDEPGVPWLAKKHDLAFDSAYQRTMVSESRIATITQAWSWLSCGSLIVSERDGKFWVIDGQHRVAAAMRRSDIQELPCLVFKFASKEEEAMAFYRANCIRGNVTPFDKLRALLAAGEPLARSVVELMGSHGYKPSSGEGANTVRCVSAFVDAMKKHRTALVKVWPLIAALHDGLSIKVKVFKALLYLARFGTDDITSPEWRDRVLRHGLSSIEHHIDQMTKFKSMGGEKLAALATLEVINKGLPKKSRMSIDEAAPDDEAQ